MDPGTYRRRPQCCSVLRSPQYTCRLAMQCSLFATLKATGGLSQSSAAGISLHPRVLTPPGSMPTGRDRQACLVPGDAGCSAPQASVIFEAEHVKSDNIIKLLSFRHSSLCTRLCDAQRAIFGRITPVLRKARMLSLHTHKCQFQTCPLRSCIRREREAHRRGCTPHATAGLQVCVNKTCKRQGSQQVHTPTY